MQIRIFDSTPEVAAGLAERIAGIVFDRPESVIALPTGRSPLATYEALGKLCADGKADFSRTSFFALDEFVGLPEGHPASFRAYLERHLFPVVNFNRRRVRLLDANAADLDAECRAHELAIQEAGGLDLCMLGIGANGHIGFNEPGDVLGARTQRVTLHMATRRDNAAAFGGKINQVPREALSMGMATLLNARTIVLVATGKEKAGCVEQSVRGPLTTRLPASFLQTHRDVEFYLDREAASLLRGAADGDVL
jgi:glucosamine-6-phosphate deaminase